jgi:hypothetical protein
MFELVELDPETGEEDSRLAGPGTFRQMEKAMARSLDSLRDDEACGFDWTWPVLRIQPAS